MSCAFRCIALRLAAYLLYHFVVRLSRGFSNFFQVFSSSRLSPTLRCRSLAAPIVYHILPRLSTPFCKFFRDFSIFPAGKVTALGLWVLYWLHQCGIPRHTCRFIRKLRYSLVVSFGFLNEEYLIALVDFIIALRRTKGRGRRTLRSPPSPSSGLHLIHPGLSAAAGHFGCRGWQGYRIPVSGADCLSPLRRIVWVLCVRAWTVRVSVDFVGHMSFVFHYWWKKRRCLFGFVARSLDYRWPRLLSQFRWMQVHFTKLAG